MMTTLQLQALKADILATPELASQPQNADGFFFIAQYYNQASSPEFIVWKTNVPVSEIMNNGFVWTAVDALTAGKARIWEWMASLGSINPSKPNIRQGLADAFGANSPMANGILPHLKRIATRAERLFAVGTGTNAQPGTMDFEGNLTYQNVEEAMRN